MLEQLRKRNPEMEILPLTSPEFSRYGMTYPEIRLPQMKEFVMAHRPDCEELYIPCENELMEMEEARVIKENLFGQVPCQIGYYFGRATKLNAVEYHKCSEILVQFYPAVLLLGSIWEIEEGKIDSAKMKAFYVPADTCVELYATTLHYSPLMVSSAGVAQVVIQAAGTNTPFVQEKTDRVSTDRYLLERNKWVLIHEEYRKDAAGDAYAGIAGDNITLHPIG